MCDCNKKIVDLSHLKIYTIMATYKAKLSSGSTYKGDFKITWARATQEELAYAYEEVGLNNLIEKITKTKDESEKTSKKKSSKKADSTKE
tara:strand:+ start:172 stop:441 length:270 start_codon:yes stop_codon:yes gene_type:complete